MASNPFDNYSLEELEKMKKEGVNLSTSQQIASGLENINKPEARQYSRLQALYGGAATTAKRGVLGIEQMLANAMVDEAERPAVLAELARRNAMNEEEAEAIGKSRPGYAFAGDILGGSALLAPTFAIPGAGVAGIVGKAASKVAPRVAASQAARTYAPIAGRGGFEGTLAGGMNYVGEGESRAENAFLGALIGTTFAPAIASGINYGAGKVTNLFKSPPMSKRAINDIMENERVARGTETSLGRVINNPTLSKFEENILPNIPGSGMPGAQMRTGEQIRGRANAIGEELYSPNVPDNMTLEQAAHRKLYEGAERAKAQDKMLYQTVSRIAKKNDVYTSLNNEMAVAQKYLGQRYEDPFLDAALSGPVGKVLESLAEQSPGRMRTFEEAHKVRSNYLKQARDINPFENPRGAQIMSELARASEDEMGEAAQLSNIPVLMDAYEFAKDSFKLNTVPLRENRNLAKSTATLPPVTGQKVRLDEAVSEAIPGMFIKTGRKNDAVGVLKQLTHYLDAEGLDLYRNVHFKNAFTPEGDIDVKELLSAWKTLGPKQRSELFKNKPHLMESLSDFERLQYINPKAFQQMFNPPTGHSLGLRATFGGIASAGAVAGASLFGPAGALVGGLAAIPLSAIGARAATKALTNEQLRSAIVKAMTKSSGKRTGDINEEMIKTMERINAESAKMVGKGVARKEAGETQGER